MPPVMHPPHPIQFGRGGASAPLVFGRGVGGQPFLRMGPVMIPSEMLRQRGPPSEAPSTPRQHEWYTKSLDPHLGPKIGLGPPSSADAVGYSGSGGGAGRVSLAPQNTTVSGQHPPYHHTNSNPQMRAPPSSSLPHNAVHSHSQLHPHSHSANPHYHQSVISTVSVSGAPTAPIVNPVQQPSVTPGQAPTNAGQGPHELGVAQAIHPSAQPPQITQVSGVGIAGSGQHIMYPSTSNTSHHQNPQSNPQFYIGHQGANPLHPGGQQPRPAIHPHPQNVQGGYPYFPNFPQFVQPHLFSQYSQVNTPQASVRPTYLQHSQYPQTILPIPAPQSMYYQPHGQQQPQQQPAQQQKPPPASVPKERASHAIPIINPDTNRNIFEEGAGQNALNPRRSPSPTHSRDSGAPNSPAPVGESIQPDRSHSSNIQAQFARQVAQVVDDSNQTGSVVAEFPVNTSKDMQPANHNVMSTDNKERFVNSVENVHCEPSNPVIQNVRPDQIVSPSVPPATGTQVPNVPPPNKIDTSAYPPPQPQRPPKQPRGSQSSSNVSQSKPSPPPMQTMPPQPKQSQSQGKPPMQQKSNQSNRNQNSQQPPNYQGKGTPQPSTGHKGGQQSHSQKPIHSSPQQHIAKQDIPGASKAVSHQMQQPEVQHVNPVPVQQPQAPPSKAQSMGSHAKASSEVAPNPKSLPHKSNEASSTKPVEKKVSQQSSESKKDRNEQSQKRELSEHGKSFAKDKKQDVSASQENSKPSKDVSSKAPQEAKSIEDGVPASGKPSQQAKAHSTKAQAEKVVSESQAPSTATPPPSHVPKAVKAVHESLVAEPRPDSSTTTAPQAAATPPTNTTQIAPPRKETPNSEQQPLKPEEEPPKATKPPPPPAVSTPVENHAADKPKSSSLSNYSETETQPSSDTVDGKRQYDRDFLLELQNNPLSKQRPDSLPNIEVVLNGPMRSFDGKPRVLSDFTPAFMLTPNNRTRNNMYGTAKFTKNSQQGKKMPRVIDIKLTSNADVKLKTTENAWKPSTLKETAAVPTSTSSDPEESASKHDNIIKRMRGILNKLTPDNFAKLVVQVKSFNIEKLETFEELIGIVFEKALDEQAFSATYAQLCNVLRELSVRSQDQGDEAKFRNLIISRCQSEFERDRMKELKRGDREKAILNAETEELRQELKEQFIFDEQQIRRRSVGNIRFIGELYKQKMLTSHIMMRIIQGLVQKKDAESLECLCKLLTTIGWLLEKQVSLKPKMDMQEKAPPKPIKDVCQFQEEFNQVFLAMKALVNEKNTSSRVRFLMMDVIDLRVNHWVPRREEGKPKTKAQVHEEIRKEEIEAQLMMMNAPRPGNDRDKVKGRPGGMRDDGGFMGGSNLMSPSNRRINFDSSRLKNTTFSRHGNMDNNVVLRPGMSNWTRGSSGGGGVKEEGDESLRLDNRFALLENAAAPAVPSPDMRRPPPTWGSRHIGGGNAAPHRHHGVTSYGSKSMPSPSEKDNLLASVKYISNLGDRSKSNSRASSRDSSLARNSTPPISESASMSDEAAYKAMKGIIEEYVANPDLVEATLCLQEKFRGATLHLFVQHALEWALDRSAEVRKRVAALLHHLLSHKVLSVADLEQGSKGVFEMIHEYVIDIPQVYSNMGEILARLLIPELITLKDLLRVAKPASPPALASTFTETLKHASKLMSAVVVADLWRSFGLRWDMILPSDVDVLKHLKEHNLEYLSTGNSAAAPPTERRFSDSVETIRTHLASMFKNKSPDEKIFEWIDANLGEEASSPKLVRALTKALIESLFIINTNTNQVVLPEDFEESLGERAKFICKYVDNVPKMESQCIYAMQALAVQYEHPNKLLDRCFVVLYQHDALSYEAFIDWETDPNPEEQVGKGVCVKSAKSFLDWLKEPEPEGDTS